jgi:hypothetical protein
LSGAGLFALLLAVPASALAAADKPAATGPLISIELDEQAGIYFTSIHGLNFIQYSNDIGANLSFGLSKEFWLGFGGGYFGLLPSVLSDDTPLAAPGMDALRISVFADLRSDSGLALRLGPHACFAQIQQTGNHLFFLGADLAASWLFCIDALGIEPAIGTSWQFRKDVPLSFNLNLQVRISFQAKELQDGNQ